MKVKKYIVKSMAEARASIETELGKDAIILHSKEVETGGFLGFFTKKKLEVIAAVDLKEQAKPGVIKKSIDKVDFSHSEMLKAQHEQSVLTEELKTVKSLLKDLSEQNKFEVNQYPAPIEKLSRKLQTHGVSPSITQRVLKKLMMEYASTLDQTPALSANDWELKLENVLNEELRESSIGNVNFDKKIIQLIGPTGVGKTTTIAKLAAWASLKKQKKVAFITTDTYRIAAVEQLKTYAKILELPLEVVYTMEEMRQAKQKFEQYDLILIDSAGRNFTDRKYVSELSQIIDFKEDAHTYLVLSLTSKYEDMKQIIEQFSLIEINHVILTKKDETSSLGALLNIPIEEGLQLACVSHGQNVPDDWLIPTKEWLVSQIIRGDEHD